ncbi:MAG: endonuclease/exonuclease/phosphatase family protein [Candidatus Pacebacteria bacterium]|nr:endonuclease/exonuclease/phosphatase family protein [Candidatus Paceibacterota bacterium]
MDYKLIISIIAIILVFAGYVPYIRDTIKGSTRPHIFSYLLWLIIISLNFALQINSGGGFGAWVTFFTAFVVFIVFVLSFKNGKKDIRKVDFIFLALALMTIPLWLIAKQPILSVILLSTIDMFGFIPTIRKSWNDPWSETLSRYTTTIFRHGLAIIALAEINIVTVLFPITWVLANLLFAIMLIIRRKRLKREIKVLSWNIWVDCHFDKVKEFFYSYNADIIGLQELKDNDSSRDVIGLLSEMGYQYTFAMTEQIWDGKLWRHGPAIFSKYPIIKSEKIQLATGDDERVAVYAKIDVNGTILNIFSTHLIHTHQQPSLAQDEQIQKIIGNLPDEKVVVMGDFNATPESNGIQLMNKVLVNTNLTNLPTWSVYSEGCPKCNPQHIDVTLDYIFVSKDIKFDSFKIEESKASDHLPISIDIRL